MKNVIKLMIVSMMFLLVGCASNHDKYKHHHHVEFNQKCAYSIAKHDMNTMGKKEYFIKHEEKVFYFSSEENMKSFKKHIRKNLELAQKNWMNRRR